MNKGPEPAPPNISAELISGGNNVNAGTTITTPTHPAASTAPTTTTPTSTRGDSTRADRHCLDRKSDAQRKSGVSPNDSPIGQPRAGPGHLCALNPDKRRGSPPVHVRHSVEIPANFVGFLETPATRTRTLFGSVYWTSEKRRPRSALAGALRPQNPSSRFVKQPDTPLPETNTPELPVPAVNSPELMTPVTKLPASSTPRSGNPSSRFRGSGSPSRPGWYSWCWCW